MMMNCFCDMVTDERRLALFPAVNIVRDPHHRESPNLSSGLGDWSCAVVITSTLRRHDTTHFNVNKFQAIIYLINFDDLTALIICLDSF